ncbi:PAS domain S-box protein [Fuchsiella alkaliacetigena]|uniref:PAS domain S-box protein n=1 Tax=Fuchsiella alkaliacetigena TaxID=957042 RepID=UPI00200B86D9|nr:PAS domain S-box protein [Fuchsiella alkaliacetigena]MCK8825685.1 PAS domain S-box protein [Fuchsiella alkaliacetigena]
MFYNLLLKYSTKIIIFFAIFVLISLIVAPVFVTGVLITLLVTIVTAIKGLKLGLVTTAGCSIISSLAFYDYYGSLLDLNYFIGMLMTFVVVITIGFIVDSLREKQKELKSEIQKRVELENKLKQERNLLRRVIDNSPNCIFVKDQEGTYKLANEKLSEVFGVPKQEIVGSKDQDFNLTPEELESFQTDDQRVLTNKQSLFIAQEKLTDAAGQTRWFQTTKLPLQINENEDESAHLLAIATDVTEHKELEEELKQTQHMMENIIQKVGVIFWSLDLDSQQVTYVSDSCQQLYGYSAAEFCNQYQLWKEMVHPADLPQLEQAVQKLYQTKESVSLEHRVKRADGEIIWVKYFMIPIFNDQQEIVRLDGISYEITELKQAQKKLDKSRQLYKNIVESQQEMICRFEIDTTITFANQAYQDCFGISEADLGNIQFLDLVPEERHEQILVHLAKLANEREPITYEHQAETEQGLRWQEWTDYPIFDEEGKLIEFQSIGLDITERKKAEAELELAKKEAEKASNRYQSLLAAQRDMIIRIDTEGRYTYVNQVFCESVAKEQEELWGQSCEPLVHEEDISKLKKELVKLQQPPYKSEIELRINTVQGVRWVAWKAHSIRNEEGEVVEIQSVGRDITELKEALAKAEAANKAKSEFLANMSHEIRTPLNAVIGFSEILASQLEDAQQQDYLTSIQTSARALLELINEILDLSKIEAGILEVEPQVMDLNNLLFELEEIFKCSAEQKGLELIIEADTCLPAIYFDETRLRQILVNLIGNAIKFTKTGQVKLSVESEVKNEQEKLTLLIFVEDTGIGIAAQEEERIFKAFTQQSTQKVGDYGGAGLGLTITQRLTKLMGGEISYQSQVGEGTTFRLEFPEVQIAKKPQDEETESGLAVENIFFEPAKILIVDDVDSNRELLKIKLQEKGLEVIAATNGREGVEQALEYEPELVLMDLKMPKVDGYQAYNLIKKEGLEMPIIALTAFATREEEQKVQQAGFSAFLTKPINEQELYSQLTEYLDYYLLNQEPQDLIQVLEGRFMQKYRELTEVLVLNYAEDFAQELLELAQQRQVETLLDYAQRLQNHIQNFNLESLEKELSSFPEQIELLKEINQD